VSDSVARQEETRDVRRPTEPRPKRPEAPAGGIGLRIYKPGQGYYTRVGTAVGIGVLVFAGARFLFTEVGGLMAQGSKYLLPVQYGVATGFMLIMGAVIYWLVGRSRKANDFFIATEGEMKKVSWSSRKEVVRSTKVVIVTVIIMGVFLFLADIMFMLFFSSIKVLEGTPTLMKILGMES